MPFPFSDLSRYKLRPALVLADAGRGDWVLCEITSKPYADLHAVMLDDVDFDIGSLRVKSYARPGKLITANESLMVSQVGRLKPDSFARVMESLIDYCDPPCPKRAGGSRQELDRDRGDGA
ncbi:MAG: MazF family transcriptional regulator [Pseudomonadota bacterium]|nr:MazF family transcriptional regulator [Pseudomonadota bacterium]